MSEALDEAVKALKSKVGEGGFDGSVRFDIEDEGSVRLDDSGVSESDAEADCVISGSLDTFREMFDGELDPTSAFMTGRIKIDGDMSVAMKLAQVFS